MSEPSPLAGPRPWNLVAEGYAEELVPLFAEYAGEALERGGLTAESAVLDVATGPGTLAVLASPRAARVVGVDFAEEMLAIARRRVADAGATNVELHLGDGQSLEVASGSFDAAISMFGLMFFPDRAAGFRELARVLRPGGRAVVSSWTPIEESPLLTTLFGAIREELPELPFGQGAGPLSRVEAIHEEMTAGGFREVRVDRVVRLRQIASVRHLWESQARSSAPMVVLREKMSSDEWEAFAAGVVERLEREMGIGPIEAGWPAFLGVGVR